MNILLSQKIAGFSGSEYYLSKILPELKSRGINVIFLAITTQKTDSRNQVFYRCLKEHKIPCFKYFLRFSLDFGLLKEIKKIVLENKIDLIHSHLIHADFWIAMFKAFVDPKIKYVSTKHGYHEKHLFTRGFSPKIRKLSLYKNVALLAEKFTSQSFTISHGLYDLYTNSGICKQEKTRVIHYGFDFKSCTWAENKRRFSSSQIVVVGRLVPYKGHQFVIDAVDILKEKHPDILLVVVGDGWFKDILKEIVAKKNLDKHIIFAGYQKNVTEYLLDSDIMIISSIAEGFGIVLLEGFSAEIPVISFDVPAPNEIIEHGKTGLLALPKSVEDLAYHIDKLLSDRDKGKELAKEAKAKLLSYFNLDRMVNETIDFYKETLYL